MRRIRIGRSERGVAAPITAFLMVFLLGMAAFAVDVGSMYSEHAQLQNGADAAAIAIAQKCSKLAAGTCPADQTAYAAQFANGNTLDSHGQAIIATVSGNTVNVTIQAQDPSASNHFSLVFARALGIQTADIRASAQAKWGPLSSGGAFPLAISDSCFNLSSASQTAQVQTIAYKPGGTCTGPSGTQIPGGWGWLQQSSPCYAATQLGNNTIGSDPGNNPPTLCKNTLQGWEDTILAGGQAKVTFPVFDDATNQGKNGTFHIIGYATFNVWGWKFGNGNPYEFRNTKNDPNMTSSLACSGGNDRCIIGQFIKYQTIDAAGSGGGGSDLGTENIGLSN